MLPPSSLMISPPTQPSGCSSWGGIIAAFTNMSTLSFERRRGARRYRLDVDDLRGELGVVAPYASERDRILRPEVVGLVRVAVEVVQAVRVGVEEVVQFQAALDERALGLVVRIAGLIDQDRAPGQVRSEELRSQALPARVRIGRDPRELEDGP